MITQFQKEVALLAFERISKGDEELSEFLKQHPDSVLEILDFFELGDSKYIVYKLDFGVITVRISKTNGISYIKRADPILAILSL